MKIETEPYQQSCQNLPRSGQFLTGHQREGEIVVYQAYKPSIAAFAVANQHLGGNEYSYSRMSWIKPNFLWMMYRCGWAGKENQESVLALWINKKVFADILSDAVLSSYDPQYYSSQEAWRGELNVSEVRMQWDPDHDPHGNKLVKRAIQIGLKGRVLEKFGKTQINLIEDITDFVKEQARHVSENKLEQLVVPVERIWALDDLNLNNKIGIGPYGGK